MLKGIFAQLTITGNDLKNVTKGCAAMLINFPQLGRIACFG